MTMVPILIFDILPFYLVLTQRRSLSMLRLLQIHNMSYILLYAPYLRESLQTNYSLLNSIWLLIDAFLPPFRVLQFTVGNKTRSKCNKNLTDFLGLI